MYIYINKFKNIFRSRQGALVVFMYNCGYIKRQQSNNKACYCFRDGMNIGKG